jgi:hypothetical protein
MKNMGMIAGIAAALAVLTAAAAVSAQDKYTLKVPNGITASRSPTAPKWRRSIGTRKRTQQPPVSRWCPIRFTTSISW